MFTHFAKWPPVAVNGLFIALQKWFARFFFREPRQLPSATHSGAAAGVVGFVPPVGALLLIPLLLASLPGKAQCPPISTLPCDQVVTNLVAGPFVLNFTGAEGGLNDGTGRGTGFRMVDRLSAPLTPPTFPDVPGYEPSRLAVNPAGSGTLALPPPPALPTAPTAPTPPPRPLRPTHR
jgi:hypothetical protein